MTEELNTHIEKRYSECHKRSQGLVYGSFYDGYADCYNEQQKRIADLENKLANVSYQLEGREVELKELKDKCSSLLDKLYLSGLSPKQIAFVEQLQDILGV